MAITRRRILAAVRRVHRLAMMLGTVVALAGCGGSTATDVPASSPNRTPAASPLIARTLGGQPMEACPIGAGLSGLCGTLDVPEDPSKPDGRQIGLRVIVVPALAAEPEPDPVFALAGGPGGAGTTSLAWMPGTFHEIHAVRDIVLIDQRGTGASNEIPVPPMPDTEGLSDADANARWSAWAGELLGSLDADPRMYTSARAADDIDAVREALGYEQVNLYGPSYGATLGQYYLRQHPDRARVAVFDGGTPLDVPVFERIAPNSQAALDLVLARCAADPKCDAAFPGIDAELDAVLERLATPVTTNVTDPSTGEPAVLTRDDVASGIHSGLVDASTAALLPYAIHLAYEGDWQAATAVGSAGGGDAPENPLMSRVIRCSEAWARFDPDEVARAGADSYYRDAQVAMARTEAAICRHLPRGLVPVDDAAPVRTSVPVLWVVGEADPQDPPANLAAIPDQMAASRIVVVPGQGHTVGHLGCMPEVVAAFVERGEATGLDVSCIDRGGVPIPAFALP